LRPEVVDVAGMRHHLERRARDHVDAVGLEPHDLLRVIGEQPHAPDAEVAQDLGADAVVPEVFLEAELEVGLDGVASLVLERVGTDLVGEADAAPLLVEVDDDAAAGHRDLLERLAELVAAVAALGAEDVAGQALGMQPDQHVAVALHVAEHEGHVLMLVDGVVVHDGRNVGPSWVGSSASATRRTRLSERSRIWITSVTVTRGSPCAAASASSSAGVARLPSRPSTAQRAADAPRPARRDRALAGPGGAARTRTPPGAPS